MRQLNALFVLWLLSSASIAEEVLLFDATLGTTPGAQAWLEGPSGPYASHNGQGVALDTTASNSVRYGFSTEDLFLGLVGHPNMPTLNRHEEFSIEFDLQIIVESHELADRNSDGLSDRAGFSLIVISQDLLGIELGFFTDRVWAQEFGFFQAESGLWNTQQWTHYRLSGNSSGYMLEAKNASQPGYVTVLSGGWRNYNPSGISDPFLDPYNNPSILFVGDNTTSAAASVVLGDLLVRTGPLPIPAVTSVPVPVYHLAAFCLLLGYAALARIAVQARAH